MNPQGPHANPKDSHRTFCPPMNFLCQNILFLSSKYQNYIRKYCCCQQSRAWSDNPLSESGGSPVGQGLTLTGVSFVTPPSPHLEYGRNFVQYWQITHAVGYINIVVHSPNPPLLVFNLCNVFFIQIYQFWKQSLCMVPHMPR